MARRAPLLITATALAVLLLGVGQAQSLRAFDFKIKSSPHKDGPYKLLSEIRVRHGETESAYWSVENTTNATEHMGLGTATEPYDGYNVKWFRGNKDITDEVEGPNIGYEFNLKARRTIIFRSTVKKDANSAGGTCIVPYGFSEHYGRPAYLGVNRSCSRH